MLYIFFVFLQVKFLLNIVCVEEEMKKKFEEMEKIKEEFEKISCIKKEFEE